MRAKLLYEHYKGDMYEVFTHEAKHTETEELMTVYKKIDGVEVWIRPTSMFLEEVTVNGEIVPRFRLLGQL